MNQKAVHTSSTCRYFLQFQQYFERLYWV